MKSGIKISKYIKSGLAVLIILQFLYFPSYSQISTLKGIITDTSGSPVPFATIVIKHSSVGTLSDETGSFTLNGLNRENNTIYVQCTGYETVTMNVTEKKSDADNIRIELKPSVIQIDEVVVTGKSETFKIKEKAFNVEALDVNKLQNSNLDISNALGRITGINVRESGGLGSDFKFSINGLSGKQIKFFIDGVPMENYGNSFNINNIPVNLVKRVEVYKGVVPVWLGNDALGGAVNIITNKNMENYLDVSYSYGSFNTHKASLNAKHSIGKTGIFVHPAAYFNYSDNNYIIDDIEMYDDLGNYQGKTSAERFHDEYRSEMFQFRTGIEDKAYADHLLLGITLSGNKNNVQHGVSQERVFGQVHTRDRVIMPSLEYKKEDFLVDGLSINSYISYIDRKSAVIDTSARDYNWDGSYTLDTINPHHGESNWQKTLFSFMDKTTLAVNNIKYQNKANEWNFNHTYSMFIRKGSDPYDPDIVPFSDPNYLEKSVLGLSYTRHFFSKKLSATVFSKYYVFNGKTIEEKLYEEEPKTITHYSKFREPGFGFANTLFLTRGLQLKLSYENTYRLPEGSEVFGDGLNITSNPRLMPEHSNNFNIGALFYKTSVPNHWNISANYFYRDAQNLIRQRATGAKAEYVNLSEATMQGIEAEISFRRNEQLFISINGTYQHLLNKTRYDENEKINHTYLDRLPNIPYLFANANLRYQFNDIFHESDKVSLNWYTRYVHEYYLNWPAHGSEKFNIPRQMTHSFEANYSFNSRYNLTLGASNLFNSKVYDNFRVQKPGRITYLKIRYSIN